MEKKRLLHFRIVPCRMNVGVHVRACVGKPQLSQSVFFLKKKKTTNIFQKSKSTFKKIFESKLRQDHNWLIFSIRTEAEELKLQQESDWQPGTVGRQSTWLMSWHLPTKRFTDVTGPQFRGGSPLVQPQCGQRSE